jgi:hypothetical protein
MPKSRMELGNYVEVVETIGNESISLINQICKYTITDMETNKVVASEDNIFGFDTAIIYADARLKEIINNDFHYQSKICRVYDALDELIERLKDANSPSSNFELVRQIRECFEC